MTVWIAVVTIGVGALVGLAVWVGLALDREARDAAWRRIAESRRINGDERRAHDEQAVALDVALAELTARRRLLDLREEHLAAREAALAARERGLEPGSGVAS